MAGMIVRATRKRLTGTLHFAGFFDSIQKLGSITSKPFDPLPAPGHTFPRMSRDITNPIATPARRIDEGSSAHLAAPVVASARSPAARAAEFEQLSMPLAATLYGTAYRITGDSARADDLVQETYVLAWQKFEQFESGSNFKAWIFRILILTSKNEGRMQRRQPAQLSEESQRMVANADDSGAPAPHFSAINYDEFVDDDFKRALDRLDADQRTILMLVTLAELTYQECADALVLPVGTVMSRLHRARKQLQSELYEYAKERGILRNAGAEELR